MLCSVLSPACPRVRSAMKMRSSAGARQHPAAPHLLWVWGGEGASPGERLGDLSPRSQNMKTGHRVSPRSAWFTFAPQALGESQGPAVIITKYLVLGILSTLLPSPIHFAIGLQALSLYHLGS